MRLLSYAIRRSTIIPRGGTMVWGMTSTYFAANDILTLIYWYVDPTIWKPLLPLVLHHASSSFSLFAQASLLSCCSSKMFLILVLSNSIVADSFWIISYNQNPLLTLSYVQRKLLISNTVSKTHPYDPLSCSSRFSSTKPLLDSSDISYLVQFSLYASPSPLPPLPTSQLCIWWGIVPWLCVEFYPVIFYNERRFQ